MFSNGDVQLYRDNHSEGPKYSFDWTQSGLAPVAERNDKYPVRCILGSDPGFRDALSGDEGNEKRVGFRHLQAQRRR